MRSSRTTGIVLSACLALLLGAGSLAFGSGYAIYEQGASAMAQAGAFTARASDPSALFFNPAGIMQLDGKQIYGGSTAVILSGSTFQSAPPGSDDEQEYAIAWPSALYYTHRLSDDAAWGLSITSPFGLRTQWGPSFVGRFISRESNLAVGVVNANLAFNLKPGWSMAIGLDWAKAQIRELSRNIDLSALCGPGCEGFTRLKGDGTDAGWNLALRWASREQGWRWGASYRSGMRPTIDGDIHFDVPPPVALTGLFPDGGVSAALPLPATAVTGIGYLSHKGRGKWEVEADVLWTDWSAFGRLQIDIKNNTLAVADISQLEDWHDTYSYRIGFTHHLTQSQDYRLGVYYDRNPIPDQHVRPRLPDADRKSLQAGYGFHTQKGFVVDIAYQALFFDDRRAMGSPTSTSDPVQPGLYRNFTSLVGLSLGWKF
jgi:long-chain fatty acid transport protein